MATVWGFSRDPDDRQRVEMLNDLRRIVVRETANTRAADAPSGTCRLPRILRHGRVLGRTARQPEGTSRPVVYELGKLFQLDKEHALLVASMREQGGTISKWATTDSSFATCTICSRKRRFRSTISMRTII